MQLQLPVFGLKRKSSSNLSRHLTIGTQFVSSLAPLVVRQALSETADDSARTPNRQRKFPLRPVAVLRVSPYRQCALGSLMYFFAKLDAARVPRVISPLTPPPP